MSEAVQILDHVARALRRLPSQFKDKPKISGFITAFVQQKQGLETVAFQLLLERSVDTAIGMQLDGCGEIVDEPRRGRTDEPYRIAIKAKIGQNNSKGTREDLIQVFLLLTGAEQVQLIDYFPAETSLYANYDLSALDVDEILAFCQRVVPAGVRLAFIAQYNDAEAFAFEGSIVGLGFGDDLDPTIGGDFGDVIATNY